MTWGEDLRANDEVTDMALVGRRDGRNFGYGRQLSYAGPQALKDLFGGGHYGTVKVHCDRWQVFVKWCRSEQGLSINDARQIDRKVLVDNAYLGGVVGRGDLVVSTAQIRLSSVAEFVQRSRKARIASRVSRSSIRIVALIRYGPQRSFYWRVPPVRACVRPSWLIYHS